MYRIAHPHGNDTQVAVGSSGARHRGSRADVTVRPQSPLTIVSRRRLRQFALTSRLSVWLKACLKTAHTRLRIRTNDTAPEATRTTNYPSGVLHEDEPNVHKSAMHSFSFFSLVSIFAFVRFACIVCNCVVLCSFPILSHVCSSFSVCLYTIFPP